MTPLLLIIVLICSMLLGIVWNKLSLAKDLYKEALWQVELDFHSNVRDIGKRSRSKYIKGQYNTLSVFYSGYYYV